ncbi:hypothetical protein A6V36_09095 [Paraburkholderia ginsengiterrae]|uniref:AB hydrolase-1 domain-containing protein n=1 Tax=Paraburkholderia ginsengiterrae TaxID=1462993 RepID=A0A1A9N6X5_9BURK|nr:alpha/beta hydrolase [Paraburkholderia ginsengiterrae]OAJ54975.1 hypothetical protein A6V36_09095 [Paraburkholderia ginsengiterrae]OAJ61158.1 hypothetical protein A6V37_03430 [Paraburkholderia ginsengiterrae]
MFDATAVESAANYADLFLSPKRTGATESDRTLLAAAERWEVDHDGASIAVWRWGRGKPVLLCHGWESRASHLGAFIQPLIAAGYSVIGYDAPAHGASPGSTASVASFGRALIAVANEIGPVEGLISHSLGVPASLWAYTRGLRVKASAHISGPSSLEAVLNRFAVGSGMPDGVFEDFKQTVESRTQVMVGEFEAEVLASGVRHPVLFMHDRDDREVPHAASLHMHDLVSGSSLELTSGLGHRRIIRDPGVVAVVVDFLKAESLRDQVE